MLSKLRFPSERSRGRRYPEPEHAYRNCFQRDRDRVIHSRAFRRLEAKTQVFTPGLSDHFRNRLTHTIEVAQVARTVANVLGLNEDLTEALALAHDIGHPPFAHAGEEALDHAMQSLGDRFDHNLHALRIVENFEQRYPRFPGLNLTFELREGIVKHSSDEVPTEYLPELRPPLEAQLIDLADEVAYNTADLDDGFAAGMFTAEEIAQSVAQYRTIFETVETQYPGATDRERFNECLRHLMDTLVSGLIEGIATGAKDTGVETAEDVRSLQGRIAMFTPESAQTSRELKEFLHTKVYTSPDLSADRTRSMQRIGELFQWFLDHPGRLPDGYQAEAAQTPLHRVICDYLAGMTDGYFERIYEGELGVRSQEPGARMSRDHSGS
jgi:dGTPase